MPPPHGLKGFLAIARGRWEVSYSHGKREPQGDFLEAELTEPSVRLRGTRVPGPLHREVWLPRVAWSRLLTEERILEVLCSKHVPPLDGEQEEFA